MYSGAVYAREPTSFSDVIRPDEQTRITRFLDLALTADSEYSKVPRSWSKFIDYFFHRASDWNRGYEEWNSSGNHGRTCASFSRIASELRIDTETVEMTGIPVVNRASLALRFSRPAVLIISVEPFISGIGLVVERAGAVQLEARG